MKVHCVSPRMWRHGVGVLQSRALKFGLQPIPEEVRAREGEFPVGANTGNSHEPLVAFIFPEARPTRITVVEEGSLLLIENPSRLGSKELGDLVLPEVPNARE